MKKILCFGLAVLLILCQANALALTKYSKEDVPKGTDETFEPIVFENKTGISTINSISFDIDKKGYAVVIFKLTYTNIENRAPFPDVPLWITADNFLKTGRSSALMGASNYPGVDLLPKRCEIGETVDLTLVCEIDNFDDTIYFYFIGSGECREFSPRNIEEINVVQSDRI